MASVYVVKVVNTSALVCMASTKVLYSI